MTELNVVTHQKPNEESRPLCNVSQKFNFTVGAIALLVALGAFVLLVVR